MGATAARSLPWSREIVEDERGRLAAGAAARAVDDLANAVLARLEDLGGAGATLSPDVALTPVINATGVLLHTNLGRAAWPAAAIEAARAAAAAPSMLELDPETGRRGRRYGAVEDEVVALTGAEAALVTNNNAAAVALAVGLAGRGGVAVSRGELVEIGGGVRIPEIIRRAGARLVEVGTTNRTRVADFEAALADGKAKLVLRVHPSNFAQTGFVESPDPAELAAVAHRYGAIVVDDLGSGALLDTARFGLAHEPMPSERLAAGADLVTFSGDKLVGGPQAGIIAGRRDLVERLRRDPLARAMRPDKVILAALAATLRLYRAGVAQAEIPVWRHLCTPADAVEARARRLAQRTGGGVASVESTVGGGSLPGQTLPSWAVRLETPVASKTLARTSSRRASGRRADRRRRGHPRPPDRRAGGRRSARRRDSRRARLMPGPTAVIGTAGHIDHGKTALLRALTGIDADRLPEERARGMTIDVGYAHLAFDDGVELDFVDVPGHDRLIGNMLVGAGRDRRRAPRRRGRRRAAAADARAPPAPRRAGDRRRARRRHEDRPRRAGAGSWRSSRPFGRSSPGPPSRARRSSPCHRRPVRGSPGCVVRSGVSATRSDRASTDPARRGFRSIASSAQRGAASS